MREIVLDTETTGLDPNSGHRIVEIGCVETIGKVRTGNHFHAYINPEREMPDEARRIHGLDDTFLKDKPVFAAIVGDFLDFIAEAPLVIHNAGFDMKFINAELVRHGFSALPMERAVDTVTIARRRFPGSPVNLDALCKRFEIDATARTFHGALLDATLLADVYLELSGGSQASLLLNGSEEINRDAALKPGTVRIPHRIFPVPEEELQAHSVFIGKLKNALWKNYTASTEMTSGT